MPRLSAARPSRSKQSSQPGSGAFKRAATRKALLLRVGIDRGTGGALGPIFPDGTFEYVPIPESVSTRFPTTYRDLPGRHVNTLGEILPARLASRRPHFDPDFSFFTYGDAAPRKRRQLLRLLPGDLLVFYAGLIPDPPDDRPRLFAIGYFTVKRVYDLTSRDLDRPDLRRRFGQTAHFLRRPRDRQFALVEGRPRFSKFFRRALPLGDGSDCLLRDLDGFGYRGSLLRAVGHWIGEPSGFRSLEAWLREGPTGLLQPSDRMFVRVPFYRAEPRLGDLVVDDRRLREGDWIINFGSTEGRPFNTLARINRVVRENGRGYAFSSLFWCSLGSGPLLGSVEIRALERGRVIRDISLMRHLVWRFAQGYRLGWHQGYSDACSA